MPSAQFPSFKRRVAAFFKPSTKINTPKSTNQQHATTTQVTKNNNGHPPDISTDRTSSKYTPRKILKNFRFPWSKKTQSNKSSLDPGASFQIFPQPAVAQGRDTIGSDPTVCRHRPQHHCQEPYSLQHRRLSSSRRASRISMSTDNHSLMDVQSSFSIPCAPQSPLFRYRMHYGPGIENIENMGEVVCQADSHSSQDEYIQELDKEIAKASIRVMKKHQQKQLRLRLSIDGARPGGSLNGSVVSSTTSTPVSTARCKTSRGTYETASSGPSTPGTPSSARSYFFRCKTARGTYSNSGLPSPTTPNSTRSFLSSLSLKSPTFPHRFSNKVAPSISASAAPPHYATAGPRLPLAPVTQLNNFTNPMDTEGPVMFTKKHMEYIRRIESRLKLLENSATHLALKENEQQLLKRRSLPSQQQQQQTVIADTIPIIEDISTNQQQQRLRTKPSMIRRVDAGFIDPRNARMQKRMSAIDRTDFQSPTGFSHTSPAPPRAYSFHDWASKWSYPTSAETIDFSSGGTQPSPSSAATLEATARLSPRNSSHVLCSNSDNQHKQQQKYTIDRTEHLLEHVNERASSKLRLGMALWEMETLLRQYETLVVQDFQLKLDNLRTSAAANIDTTTTQEQGDEQEHESPLQMSDGRVVRNAQKIPCSLN